MDNVASSRYEAATVPCIMVSCLVVRFTVASASLVEACMMPITPTMVPIIHVSG